MSAIVNPRELRGCTAAGRAVPRREKALGIEVQVRRDEEDALALPAGITPNHLLDQAMLVPSILRARLPAGADVVSKSVLAAGRRRGHHDPDFRIGAGSV